MSARAFRNRMRRGAALIAVCCAGMIVACGTDPIEPPLDPDGDPTIPQFAADLDFLWGQWQVTAIRTAPDGSTATMDGRSVISRRLNGQAGTEVLRIAGPDGSVLEMQSLIARRGSGARWTIARGDGGEGTFDLLQGRFAAGTGTFVSRPDSRPDGGLTRVRIEEAFEDAFELTVEHSTDTGATWQASWQLAYARGASVNPVGTTFDACDTQEHHQFDFWLGDWNAFGTDGQLNGTSDIKSRLGGCIVEENWVQNPNGISFNMFDVRSELWYQLWVDAGGGVVALQGTREGDRLRMTGDGGGNPLRITWTPLANGNVRQFGEAQQNGVWATLYDLTYAPR